MAMFPIRCVVETVSDGQCTKCSDAGSVLIDSYAIVSGFTQLSQLVDTVLTALGLQHLSYGAQGTIQVKNWKPLAFDEVTNDPDIEVENLLKDISNHLTLRILAKQSDSAVSDCLRDMKDRLLQTVWHKLPQVAIDIQQPQLKELVTNLVQGDAPQTIDAQLMYMFNVWLEQMSKGSGGGGAKNNGVGPLPWSNGRATAGVTPGSRFSSTLEVPKLEHWFRENQNPTRQKLLQFMTLLNNSSYRKHTSKITYQQICNWFINARASVRKRGQKLQTMAAATPTSRRIAADLNATGVGAEPGGELANNSNVESTDNTTTGSTDGQRSWMTAVRNSVAGKPAAAAAVTTSGTVSFGSLTCSNKLTTDSATGVATGASSSDVSAATGDDLCASPPPPQVNGQHSPSASSRASGGADVSRDEAMDDMSTSAIDQELCSSLYFNSMSMTSSRSDTAGGGGMDDLMLENGNGGGGSRAGTPSAATTAAFGSAAAGGVNANRTRLMFDPLTELPMLERWFEENPHPSWVQVDQFTEMLNVMPYRQTYPPVSAHNVKIWFKNRRAKFKRNLVVAVKAEVDAAESPSTVVN